MKDKSIYEISKQTGISWATIKKWKTKGVPVESKSLIKLIYYECDANSEKIKQRIEEYLKEEA